MKRIGIYLRARPGMGGTYQYNLSMLSAAEHIQNDDMKFIVGYSDRHWEPVLQPFGLDAVYIKSSFFSRMSANLWGLLKLPMRLWRWLAPRLHPLTRSFRKLQCDLWIFPSQDSLSYFIPVPAACSIHDLMHRYEPSFSEAASWYQRYIRETHYKTLVRWNRGILVDSETGKQQVMDSYGVDGSKIFPLPFLPPAYIYRTVSQDEIDQAREKYRLPQRFLFYPAQFWVHKNHLNLVEAMHRAQADCPDLYFVFSGGMKNNYADVMKRINALGLQHKVSNIGYIANEEVPVLYRAAEALVMPTYFGPTNIPPLEAMACDCPVAVSGIYGMKEQLGDAALYFNPDSVEEIARVITELWNNADLRQQLIEKGREKTRHWNIDAFSARLEDIVKTLTGPGG